MGIFDWFLEPVTSVEPVDTLRMWLATTLTHEWSALFHCRLALFVVLVFIFRVVALSRSRADCRHCGHVLWYRLCGAAPAPLCGSEPGKKGNGDAGVSEQKNKVTDASGASSPIL